MGKKIPNDGGTIFEIVEGFKKRNDGDLAYKALRGPVGQADFACEQINAKKIGEPLRHTHDQGPNAVVAEFLNVPAEDAIAGENSIRLVSRRGIGSNKRTR